VKGFLADEEDEWKSSGTILPIVFRSARDEGGDGGLLVSSFFSSPRAEEVVGGRSEYF
jgi:hypothetical protein